MAAAADTVAAAPTRSAPVNDTLVVAMSSAGPVLKLPPAMRAALDDYAPNYQPWRLENYVQDIVQKQPQVGALFGVVADYNGDGKDDVALDGYEANDELIFVIVSDGDEYRAVEIMRRAHDPQNRPRAEYLELQAAGPLEIPESLRQQESVPSSLAHPGFQHIHEGQAGTLHYWRDGRFVELVTGD